MTDQAFIVKDLQTRIIDAVQKKVPDHYRSDAQTLLPSLGKVVHSAVSHYKPQNANALLQKLGSNPSPGSKLLLELLNEETPLFFLAEVERVSVMRKKSAARIRQQRRNAIEKEFNTSVNRIANRMNDHSMRGSKSVVLLGFLTAHIHYHNIGPLKGVEQTRFWQQPPNRELLKREIDHHIYYFVVRILDGIRSYDLPEDFKVTPSQSEMIHHALIMVLHEVFHFSLQRIKAGAFCRRNVRYGNRGDRSVDNELFLNPRRKNGLVRLLGDIKEIHNPHRV